MHRTYSDFTSYICTHLCVCVFIGLCSFILRIASCNYEHNQIQNGSSTITILRYPFYGHIHTLTPSPTPGNHESVLHLCNFLSRILYKWNHTVCNLLKPAFAQHNLKEIYFDQGICSSKTNKQNQTYKQKNFLPA